jgi:hypothetical protein
MDMRSSSTFVEPTNLYHIIMQIFYALQISHTADQNLLKLCFLTAVHVLTTRSFGSDYRQGKTGFVLTLNVR